MQGERKSSTPTSACSSRVEAEREEMRRQGLNQIGVLIVALAIAAVATVWVCGFAGGAPEDLLERAKDVRSWPLRSLDLR